MSTDTEYIPGWRRAWLYVLLSAVLAFLAAPIFVVIPVSFSNTSTLQFPPQSLSLQWYDRLFTSARWASSAYNSLLAAMLTVCFTIPFGTMAAYGLNSIRSGAGKVISAALLLPLVVPLILIAIGLYFLYARLGLINTMTGLVAAHTMYTLPLAMTLIAAGFKRFD